MGPNPCYSPLAQEDKNLKIRAAGGWGVQSKKATPSSNHPGGKGKGGKGGSYGGGNTSSSGSGTKARSYDDDARDACGDLGAALIREAELFDAMEGCFDDGDGDHHEGYSDEEGDFFKTKKKKATTYGGGAGGDGGDDRWRHDDHLRRQRQ